MQKIHEKILNVIVIRKIYTETTGYHYIAIRTAKNQSVNKIHSSVQNQE